MKSADRKQTKPLISIIVPVYNVKKYLRKCLESLQTQKYNNIDIVIVDDGSTDGSGNICDEFVKNESRARVFHKENGGLSDARNFGIEKAKGELLAFVDSDDYVHKDYLEKMAEALEKDKSDIVVCGYNDVRPRKELVDGERAIYYCLVRQDVVDVVTWNKLYKKRLFDNNKIKFPKGKKHEDLLTTYKVISKAKKVSYLDEPLYYYRLREGSITDVESNEERLEMREVAANEAICFFKKEINNCDIAKVSLLLAKYAFVDASIRGEVGAHYGNMARKWILRHENEYRNNRYLTKRLRLYNYLMRCKLYNFFRKIV